MAEDTMTEPASAAMPARNVADEVARVVTVSVAGVLSVLSVTSPSPGKCLSDTSTPPACIPATKAVTEEATPAGSLPYPRPVAPMGAFVSTLSSGTTSATGARLYNTPAAASSDPQLAAEEPRDSTS